MSKKVIGIVLAAFMMLSSMVGCNGNLKSVSTVSTQSQVSQVSEFSESSVEESSML